MHGEVHANQLSQIQRKRHAHHFQIPYLQITVPNGILFLSPLWLHQGIEKKKKNCCEAMLFFFLAQISIV
jgi:hypothetical protein